MKDNEEKVDRLLVSDWDPPRRAEFGFFEDDWETWLPRGIEEWLRSDMALTGDSVVVVVRMDGVAAAKLGTISFMRAEWVESRRTFARRPLVFYALEQRQVETVSVRLGTGKRWGGGLKERPWKQQAGEERRAEEKYS